MILNCMAMIQRVFLQLEETNNVVVEPIALNNRDFMESYVLDKIDPLMQSTQLGIDLYTKALDLVRESIDLLNGL